MLSSKKPFGHKGKAALILTVFFLMTSFFVVIIAQVPQKENALGIETVSNTVFLSGSPLPDVSARSAVLMDAKSGIILGAKNPDERLPMASTTKIMTALVALENADPSKTVEVSPLAVGVEGSSIYLFSGERLTLEELLYAMLLESANDAAAAIAIEVGGSIEGFSVLMNRKADSLGLSNTHFTNPHGLDGEEHYTTARELAIIARAALENESFAKIVSTYKKTIPLNGTEGVRLLINHNKLLKNYDGAVGVKTGFTKKSGRCLVSAAERDGMRLICVTLQAPNDWQDHKAMLDHGFKSYSSRLLCHKGEVAKILPAVGGMTDHITVVTECEARVTLPSTAISRIEQRIELRRFEYAPIQEGERLGSLIFTLDGEIIANVPLIAGHSVEEPPKKSFWDKINSFFK